MKTKSVASLIAGTGLLIATAPAFAVTIDGVNFPTTSGPHSFAGTITENTATNPGEELTGGGMITTVEGSTDFCSASGCELTYEFGGFNLEEITFPEDADDNTGNARFSGGYVNFYVNGDRENPWLTTEADIERGSEYTLEGFLTNGGTDQAQNTAVGLLSVTGGSAASIFDNDSYENGSGGLSDLLFNISASPSGDMEFSGSADAHYVSPSEVPEPSDLSLLGLGLALIGFGAAYRRRQNG